MYETSLTNSKAVQLGKFIFKTTQQSQFLYFLRKSTAKKKKKKNSTKPLYLYTTHISSNKFVKNVSVSRFFRQNLSHDIYKSDDTIKNCIPVVGKLRR